MSQVQWLEELTTWRGTPVRAQLRRTGAEVSVFREQWHGGSLGREDA